jgi:hypothetical protein
MEEDYILASKIEYEKLSTLSLSFLLVIPVKEDAKDKFVLRTAARSGAGAAVAPAYYEWFERILKALGWDAGWVGEYNLCSTSLAASSSCRVIRAAYCLHLATSCKRQA